MKKLKESTSKVKKLRATQNKAKDIETKNIRRDLEAQLGRAVMKQSKMSYELNKQNELCERLATEIEKLN